MSSSWIRKEKREAIYRRDNYKCAYCGCTCKGDELTLDHVKPRAKRGRNEASNLVTACRSCNLEKSNKTMNQYIAYLEGNGIDLRDAIKRRVVNAKRRKLVWLS